MKTLKLPKFSGTSQKQLSADTRLLTIIGANGAGKTRFTQEMIALCEERAFPLSALSATFPASDNDSSSKSISDLYQKAVETLPYMRSDATTPLDKLIYMLFADEFEYLLSVKTRQLSSGKKIELEPTNLDILKRIWEHIFPDNKIVRHNGRLMFATASGNDLIPSSSLSQGEKTALYYIAAVLYAPENSAVFIDTPSLFIHPSILKSLWNEIEQLRPDCLFIYSSVDLDFVNSRPDNTCVWVKSFNAEEKSWDFEFLTDAEKAQEVFIDLAGSRKPVMFIEGDTRHSIDNRLYSLVFPDYTIRPLGSCNKVIESTRSFNDLKYLHHLSSVGIVDRDRRTDTEVAYLNRKNILVPEVAEIENIFMLESVISIMARIRGRNAEKILEKVKKEVFRMFKSHADQQALQHVRHKMKRDVECKIDARFSCITALETHIKSLIFQLRPREYYNEIKRDFNILISTRDYDGILKVFNHKPMLSESNVAQLLGYKSKDAYIAGVIDILGSNLKEAVLLSRTIRHCLGIKDNNELTRPAETPRKNEKFFTLSQPEKRVFQKRKNKFSAHNHNKRHPHSK